MSTIKQMMEEEAAKLGTEDISDPRVAKRCNEILNRGRKLSVYDKLYLVALIVLETIAMISIGMLVGKWLQH